MDRWGHVAHRKDDLAKDELPILIWDGCFLSVM